ncbi:MAG: Tetrathionate reductase subunit B precursor [Syntrophorhabdaceae bacterium PtaU1.Bin034]|nr:MAG: Tetrathionate reductase subunit B precursor [Syntrophorhabdaceae bacterium PtaU1.Bin034]
MGTIFNTRHLGDILLSTGRKLAGQSSFPESSFYEVLRRAWDQKRKGRAGEAGDASFSEDFWQQSLRRGGVWRDGTVPASPAGSAKSIALSLPANDNGQGKPDTFDLILYPTIQFFDGRTANRPFLRETPDPVTMITWDGWVEINPATAEALAVKKGDLVAIRAGDRTIRAPAFPYFGVLPGTLALPVGLGHTDAFGRYAVSDMGNPMQLLSGELDQAGSLIRSLSSVTIEKTGDSVLIAHTDGSAHQHRRQLARSLPFEEYRNTRKDMPDIIMPLPSGYSKDRDFYPAHPHVDYRWGMVIDLDRCIGCQACVVACYAENNVGTVGKKNVLLGREMSWLRIERYFETEQPYARFLPMLCQHCDSAPCESMCPVFAPQHSPEGINNQVYNRCIGTRDCNQNCPYKVRRFNWFTWKHDHPLEWQLNPDVTVRQKGVMEKCSFCIQRIVEAKSAAAAEGRKLRDGEFTTACAQTCPADVITFGSLMDPESKVSKLLNQGRAYQVLGRLNTKPAVIYLKKITRQWDG